MAAGDPIRRMGLILGAGAVILLACAAPAEAATYYVRKTGDDANSGFAPDQAFLTISQAASLAMAGDMVYVGAGTYVEMVSISRSGTADASISYIADTSGELTGDAGDVIVTGSGARDFVFYSKGYSFIRLVGFRLTGSNKKGVHFEAGEGISIQGCRIYQNGEEGLYFKGAVCCAVTDCRSYSNGKSGIYIEDKGAAGGSTISRCIFSGNSEWGVRSMSEAGGPTQIVNNVIAANSNGGIEANGHGTHLVFNNTLSDNANDGLVIKATGTATAKNNIFAFGGGMGVKADGACTSDHNLFWRNGGADDWGHQLDGLSPGPNDFIADPLFQDRANSDYKLASGSPAINAGVAAGAPTDDFEGQARSSGDGFVDVGADERRRARLRIVSWRQVER